MIKSIRGRLISIYLAVVLVVMISSGIFIIYSLEDYEYGKLEEDIKLTSSNLLNVLDNNSDRYEMERVLKNDIAYSREGSKHIYILKENGEVIASAGKEIERFDTEAIMLAKAGESSFERIKETDSAGYKREIVGYATKIGGNILYVRVYADNIVAKLDKTKSIIMIATGAALVVTFIIGAGFSLTLTKPIKALTIKAKEMASGNLDSMIPVKSDDEIGELTKSFNNMAMELNKTLFFVSNEKNKMETVLENMEDGVLAFNSSGDLIHNNRAVYKLLTLSEIPLNFDELFKKFELNIKFKDIIEKRTSSIQQIEHINKRFININISSYFNENDEVEGIVVVFRDITKQAKLEEMRKGFIADVSHEMKTPLTTIQTYAETLLDGANEDKKMSEKFLTVIINEVLRMDTLVSDLLDLSKLENNKKVMDMNKIDIVRLVKKEIKQKQVVADKKNQKIIFKNTAEKIDKIRGDSARVHQVIRNIISNAMKYSDENSNIYVTISKNDNFVKVSVKDEGQGISKEDQTRIFERFYRVDKSRSRKTEGTGLGLAIVKKIMDYHEGKIAVESEIGKGSTFHLSFKVDK